MPYYYDRCPRTGFAIKKWVWHDSGDPAENPSIEEIRERRVDAVFDSPECCSISMEDLNEHNLPYFYLNEQAARGDLHAYDAAALQEWLSGGKRTDVECRANMGSPYAGLLLPVYPDTGRPHAHAPLKSTPPRPPLYMMMEALKLNAVNRLQRELWGYETKVITADLDKTVIERLEAQWGNEALLDPPHEDDVSWDVVYFMRGYLPKEAITVDLSNEVLVYMRGYLPHLIAEIMGDIPRSGITAGISKEGLMKMRGYLTGETPLPQDIINMGILSALEQEFSERARREVTAVIEDELFRTLSARAKADRSILLRIVTEFTGRMPRRFTAGMDLEAFVGIQEQLFFQDDESGDASYESGDEVQDHP